MADVMAKIESEFFTQFKGDPVDSKIKETMELIAALKGLVGIVAKVLEDGKVGIADIRYVPSAISELRSGLVGIKMIPEEVKTLSNEDLQAIVAAVIDLGLDAYEKFAELPVVEA